MGTQLVASRIQATAVALPEAGPALLAGWSGLAERCAVAATAQPAFLKLWAQTRLRTDETAQLVVAHEGDQLVGVLPVMIGPSRLGGFRLRAVQHLGRNAYVPGVHALILSSDHPVASEVANALARATLQLPNWDLVHLNSLPADGLFARELAREAARLGASSLPSVTEFGVRVDLSGGWDGIVQSSNRNRSRQLKKLVQRFTSEDWSAREYSRLAGLEQGIDQCFQVADQSWQGEQGTSIANDPAAREFYRRLASEAAQRGELSLWILSKAAQPVAYLYCIVIGQTAYALKTGFVPEHRLVGPGVLVHGAAFREFATRGITAVQLFHPPSEDKRRWGPALDPHDGVRILAPSFKGRLLGLAERLRRLGS
jgi:CelD/BcsL family acetyltransferase involved in cellulose biosynthesis